MVLLNLGQSTSVSLFLFSSVITVFSIIEFVHDCPLFYLFNWRGGNHKPIRI